ncbi:MAG TPA: GDSL-type esterase/lipase family protein [Candidatus Acidoferrum sp.]|nr:GDSL-type esterase/lipase family protein [Candidatus Acidoferrum sp.]
MKNPVLVSRRDLLLLSLFLGLTVLASPALLADPPPPLTIRVACVGDSITYGSTLTNREADCYPACLGRLLGAGYDVHNFGVSGATMLHKGDLPYVRQKAHAAAVAFKPDIVIIMLGANDSKHDKTGKYPDNWKYKADYVPDYEALIGEFRKANPAVRVYVCCPTPSFPGNWGINNTIIHDEIIPLVHQVATDENASIIDLYDAFAGRSDLFPDTVHPNDAGAGLLASTIYADLRGKTP